jgi:hypothetical protein
LDDLPSLPSGFVPPCLPTKAPHPPTGAVWLHEIKHDGFRVVARKQDDRVRLYSRLGNDLRQRFPSVAEALHGLNLHSCILDGEAVAYDDARMLRSAAPPRPNGAVSLYAFDPPAVETAGARTGHRMELDRGSAPMVTHFHVFGRRNEDVRLSSMRWCSTKSPATTPCADGPTRRRLHCRRYVLGQTPLTREYRGREGLGLRPNIPIDDAWLYRLTRCESGV